MFFPLRSQSYERKLPEEELGRDHIARAENRDSRRIIGYDEFDQSDVCSQPLWPEQLGISEALWSLSPMREL